MSPSSQSTYVKGGKVVTLTIADAKSGLKASQTVYYAWSTSSSTAPTSWRILTTSNTAGAASATVTVPASASSSLTGTYYLWVKGGTISDIDGNTSAVMKSNAFKFDNTKPTISVKNSSSSQWVSYGTTVTISGTVYDAHSGINTSTLYYSYDNSTEKGNDWSVNNGSTFSGVWRASREQQVWVRVADNAGNYSNWVDAGYVRISS